MFYPPKGSEASKIKRKKKLYWLAYIIRVVSYRPVGSPVMPTLASNQPNLSFYYYNFFFVNSKVIEKYRITFLSREFLLNVRTESVLLCPTLTSVSIQLRQSRIVPDS